MAQIGQAASHGDHRRIRDFVADERGEAPPVPIVESALRRGGQELVRLLDEASRHPERVRVTARYQLANGESVVIERRNGEYRVRFAPLPPDCPPTVLDAIQVYRAALNQRAWVDVAFPLTLRARLEAQAETQAILDVLAHADELDVVEGIWEAKAILPIGYQMSLRLQRGCWFVDEVK
jgi:hypothetical protein